MTETIELELFVFGLLIFFALVAIFRQLYKIAEAAQWLRAIQEVRLEADGRVQNECRGDANETN